MENLSFENPAALLLFYRTYLLPQSIPENVKIMQTGLTASSCMPDHGAVSAPAVRQTFLYYFIKTVFCFIQLFSDKNLFSKTAGETCVLPKTARSRCGQHLLFGITVGLSEAFCIPCIPFFLPLITKEQVLLS